MASYREHTGVEVREWEMLWVLAVSWNELGFGDAEVVDMLERKNGEVWCQPTSSSG